MHRPIKKCRICQNSQLEPVINLEAQSLTGVFPATREQRITKGPLSLVKCSAQPGREVCGLVQLEHSYVPEEMYGMNYGYRSGLNPWMKAHLKGIVEGVCARVAPGPGDLIIDIGSNDSTLLQSYETPGATLLGIDPTGVKLREYYPAHIQLVPDFFSAERVRQVVGNRKASIVTSIAMLYDLEDPEAFFRQVHEVLADDGIWVFEQSYMPTMLAMTSYDTICHEHIEYYCLRQIKWVCDRVGLKILDVELNGANGGSFRVTVAKSTSRLPARNDVVAKILSEEESSGLSGPAPYTRFRERVAANRERFVSLLTQLRRDGKRVIGSGASTKGNVILQYCGITPDIMPCIAEINADKFGCFTPGTCIPIVSEVEARAMKPDYMVVLPWHFRATFLEREKEYLGAGGRLIFPLPEVEVVSRP